VERGDERRTDPQREDEVLHAPPHLLRRLVGEGDGEHVAGGHALDGEEVGDPVRDHTGLAAARAGEHEEGPLRSRHRFPLRVIERSEDGVAYGGGH
jgi:hypothetical protein